MKSSGTKETLKYSNGIIKDSFISSSVVEDLKNELNQYKEENKQLIVQNKQLETNIIKFKSTVRCFKEENDRLKKKVRDLQIKHTSQQQQSVIEADSDSACSVRWTNATSNALASGSSSLANSPPMSPTRGRRVIVPVMPKVAEKIRLKRLTPLGEVHGSEVSALGVCSVKLAEHLAEDIGQASELSEILRSPNSSLRKREIRFELEKLRRQADNLKCQIGVLEATLYESKSNCENLSVVCAQLESNQTALQMALACGDKIQELVECLLMLTETQLSLTLASYQASISASSDKSNSNKMLITARQQRRTAEMLACQLLRRVQNFETDFDAEKAELLPDGEMLDESFTLGQEDALREHYGRLKMEKDSVQSTVLPVSTSLFETLEQNLSTYDQTSITLQEQKLMLENAVLLQELSAIKESRADIRAQMYLLERENERCRLSKEAKDTELKGYHLQLDELSSQMIALKKNKNGDGDMMLNIDLTELSSTLDALAKNADLRARKSDELINDLKGANAALLAGFERAKRKYQNKISRLSRQLALTSERYQMQIKEMKQQRSICCLTDNELSHNSQHNIVGLETKF